MNNDIYEMIHYLTMREYMKIDMLQKELHITHRQFIYRISKINQLLNERGKTELRVHDQVITVSKATNEDLKSILSEKIGLKEDYVLSRRERIICIFLMLFLNEPGMYLKIDVFSNQLQTSRTTTFSSISDLKKILVADGVQIVNNREQGYFLKGAEIDIRRVMSKSVISSLSIDHNKKIFDLVISGHGLLSYPEVLKVFQKTADRYKLNFVKSRLDELIYFLIFLRSRFCHHPLLNDYPQSLQMMTTFKEYDFSVDIIKQLNVQCSNLRTESYYLTSWILGISFGDIHADTKDKELITDWVKQLLLRFNSLSGNHYQASPKVFERLYAHIRPAYYRLLFDLPILNPLTNRAKKEYSALFSLVKETVRPYEAMFGRPIPDEEVAYLTLHFASIYFQELGIDSSEKTIKQTRKYGLIACSNGVGSSVILYNELVDMFPNIYFYHPISTHEIKDFSKPVDILFVTDSYDMPKEIDIPVVVVHPVISLDERYQLIHEVDMRMGRHSYQFENLMRIINEDTEIKCLGKLKRDLSAFLTTRSEISETPSFKKKNIKLLDIFQSSLIQLQVSATDWQDSIRIAFAPLLKKKMVTSEYVQSTVQDLKKTGPYIVITTHVALAHSRATNGALKNALGLAVLTSPVKFGSKHNDPVKYVFSLSVREDTNHITAMAELTNLLNDKGFFQCLDNSTSPQTVIDYVKKQLESQLKEGN
ncbi:PTS sugar transporter subunit IIA [Lacticaseibacillus paracasei subsp. tolerans]|uniref:BglG family transcription antiterminator n=1 Tax=Lacticaseibacillus paracasei TaxID=1597 RepID=UPI001892ACF0|nr:PTS sugar transporter subunit IIA [Lacticaseibacillus paracasei]QPC17904.1 PTS sugar transporter subunit IIA [Lacticaseibacillus paracasei subsp. tolerans]